MRFDYVCDNQDGLILIDEKYLNEIDENLLYELDIFLDIYGKSELIYDFPGENWEDVRTRETKDLSGFCNSGKMLIILQNKDERNCELTISKTQIDSDSFIEIVSGKLILVNASELIQCLAYPDLEMEKLLEVDNIDTGVYSVEYEGVKHINMSKNL